jgi:hypothetical protein
MRNNRKDTLKLSTFRQIFIPIAISEAQASILRERTIVTNLTKRNKEEKQREKEAKGCRTS